MTAPRPHALMVNCTGSYVPILCVFLDTLHRAFPTHPEVVVGHLDLTAAQVSLLHHRYDRLRLLDLAQHRDRIPTGPAMPHNEHLDQAVFYARTLLWTDLFDAYDTVVYVDIDTLVLRPLDALFAQPAFTAVRESFQGERSLFDDLQDPELQAQLQADELVDTVAEATAANTGMLVVPRFVRDPAHQDHFRRILRQYGPYLLWGDQSMLNLWMLQEGLTPVADYTYNYQLRLLHTVPPRAPFGQAAVLHFNGLNTSGHLLSTMQAAALMLRAPQGRALYARYVALRRQLRGEGRVRYHLARLLDRLEDALGAAYWRLNGYGRSDLIDMQPAAGPATHPR